MIYKHIKILICTEKKRVAKGTKVQKVNMEMTFLQAYQNIDLDKTFRLVSGGYFFFHYCFRQLHKIIQTTCARFAYLIQELNLSHESVLFEENV